MTPDDVTRLAAAARLTPAQLRALARLRAVHRRAARFAPDGWLLVRETTWDGRTIITDAPWGVVEALERLGLVETRAAYVREGYGPKGGLLSRWHHFVRLAPEVRPDDASTTPA